MARFDNFIATSLKSIETSLNSIEDSFRKFLFTPMSEPPSYRDCNAIIAEYLEAEDRENFLLAIGENLEEINEGISNQQKKELTELKKSNDCKLLFSDILDNPTLSCEQQLIEIRNGIEIFGLSYNSKIKDIIKYVESSKGKETIHQNAMAEVKFARDFIDLNPYGKSFYYSELKHQHIKTLEDDCKRILRSNISIEKKALKLNKVISKWHKENANIIKDVKEIWLYDQNIIPRYLTDFTNLERLTLTGSLREEITDISFLGKLRNLKELCLSMDNITDISPLYKLEKLEYLNLSGNNISDISFLSELRNLKELYLDRNNITDISPLYELKNLNVFMLLEIQSQIVLI